MIRVQKYLSDAGVCSRRKAEEHIINGRVRVNDRIINELGFKVSNNDKIYFDDNLVEIEQKKIYILLNKPKGYLTTLSDEFNRKKVTDLIKNVSARIYPIGRLDKDTTGLLLLTNDGDLANKLMHPSYELIKTYKVVVHGLPSENSIQNLEKGIPLDGTITSRAVIKQISREKSKTTYEVSIHEGRNRQVRRMFDYIGHSVIELERIKYGFLDLRGVSLGKWRYLSQDEVSKLKLFGDNK